MKISKKNWFSVSLRLLVLKLNIRFLGIEIKTSDVVVCKHRMSFQAAQNSTRNILHDLERKIQDQTKSTLI